MHFPVCAASAHRHRFELIEVTVYLGLIYWTYTVKNKSQQTRSWTSLVEERKGNGPWFFRITFDNWVEIKTTQFTSEIETLRNVLQFIYVFSQKWYEKTVLAPYDNCIWFQIKLNPLHIWQKKISKSTTYLYCST